MIIGTGRLGTHLARSISQEGIRISGLYSHSGISANGLAGYLDKRGPKDGRYPIQSGKLDLLLSRKEAFRGQVLLICVPDDALSSVVRELADSEVLEQFEIVLHTSGVHDSSVLNALKNEKRFVGSIHPLQTFILGGHCDGVGDDSDGDESIFNDVPFIIEGDQVALNQSTRLVAALGGTAHQISQEAKSLYHAAAVFSSNYVSTEPEAGHPGAGRFG